MLRLAAVLATAALVAAVYWQSFADMIWQWNQSNHSHGLVVFPVAAFLVWQRRDRLAAVAARPDWLGLAAILVVLALWIAAKLAAVQVAEHLAAVALIPATIVALLGRRVAWQIAFPLLFLFFAVPLSDALVPFLMTLTADLSTAMLRLSGVPVFREGQYLTLPGGRFVVADVCSGVRYLMAGLVVTSLYANMNFRSVGRQLAFVAVTALLLIIANSVRAFLVMVIASATELRYLGGEDHIVFGWVLFAIIVFGLLWVGARWADVPGTRPADASVDDAPASRTRATRGLAVALVIGMLLVLAGPLIGDYGSLIVFSGVAVLIVLALFAFRMSSGDGAADAERGPLRAGAYTSVPAVLIVALGAGGLVAAPVIADSALAAPDSVPPGIKLGTMPGCPASTAWLEDWQPSMPGAGREASRSYRCGDVVVSVFAAAYGTPRPGAELASGSNRLYPEDWARYQRGFTTFDTGMAGPRYVVEQVVALPDENVRTWHWYEVGDAYETRGFRVKLRQLGARLLGRPAGGRVVVLSVRGADDAGRERALLAAARDAVGE